MSVFVTKVCFLGSQRSVFVCFFKEKMVRFWSVFFKIRSVLKIGDTAVCRETDQYCKYSRHQNTTTVGKQEHCYSREYRKHYYSQEYSSSYSLSPATPVVRVEYSREYSRSYNYVRPVFVKVTNPVSESRYSNSHLMSKVVHPVKD